ncbi:MAG TPA: class II glutamine amidotransferase [Jatrophihabitans sp.]|jgi:glutamine amidotransferase|uniref:class II glutamine amidotransferase n=1 Tax=Jatrophihabitans sp. TaxID=1932789 RepID=UPI002DFD044F|nr:class II glutamine amidotransferase [Jatrophihabitans sp.]
MCRLFGLHAGDSVATATFWLLDAPDSLAAQSHRNPDGVGIGAFEADGRAVVDKQPIAAWDDTEFAAAARDVTGTTFVAHVRHASTGAHTIANTHPFEQEGRLFAHNGVVEGLDDLDNHLDDLDAAHLVLGDTDSERVFALISAEIARHNGEIGEGIITAITWIAEHLPVYCVNFVLVTATDLWALRYPDTNELWLLERDAGSHFDARTDRIHARSDHLSRRPSVVVASERMDDDDRWRLLDPGELVHVASDLTVDARRQFDRPPRHQLSLSDLEAEVAASQQVRP